MIKNYSILFYVLFFSNTVFANVPAYWKESAYAIECGDHSIRDIFEDFGESFGVMVNLTENVFGACNGWLRYNSAESFLNAISIKYKLNWYFFNNTIYISSIEDGITERIKVTPDFYLALKELGLIQKKFGWGDLEDQGVAIISGPKSYVKKVKELAKKIHDKNKQDKRNEEKLNDEIYIIPLKYASVVDRNIVIRDKEVTIPGVESILNKMLGHLPLKIKEKETKSETPLLDIDKGKESFISSDVRTNSIIIKSRGKSLNYYKNIIKKLDKSQNLIEIDAIIVDINREKLLEVSTGLKYESQNGNTLLSSEIIGNSVANIAATLNIKNFGKFYSNLKLLESKGDASIVANTSILTMENQPAFIDLSNTFFIESVGERVANVEPVTIGTLLSVTPQRIKEGNKEKIKLFVDVQDGKILEETVDNLPVINQSIISTKALIEKNKSLVIGGYHIESSQKNTRKVPFLGSIPLIKHLFTSKNKSLRHEERIFIITPRISKTNHNAQDYTNFDREQLVTSALEEIKNRWEKSNKKYIDKNLELLTSILNDRLPKGYHAMLSSKKDNIPISCRMEGVDFNFTNQFVIKGHGIAVYKSKVINNSTGDVFLVESSCYGKGLMSVINIGSHTLEPEKSTYFLISVEIAQTENYLSSFNGDI